jgi:hypothetical protein
LIKRSCSFLLSSQARGGRHAAPEYFLTESKFGRTA